MPHAKKIMGISAALALLLAAGAQAQTAHTQNAPAQNAASQDNSLLPGWQLTGNMDFTDTNGTYGTQQNTNVQFGLASLSLSDDNFKFSASIPYMRISGRGLVVFDANGNPILISRRTNAPTDVRTGWGDLDLGMSYVIPPAILDGFQVTVNGMVKAPTASARRRLSTGLTDFGASIDVSRQFGIWTPFVTVGYLDQGRPAGFTLYDTTSVSAGTSLELTENLVAVASYDYDSANAPIVAAGQELSGALSWVFTDKLTLTGYGSVGLSSGSPAMGVGLQVSYGFN